MSFNNHFKRSSQWRTKNYNTNLYLIILISFVSLFIIITKNNTLFSTLALRPLDVFYNGKWWQIITHAFAFPPYQSYIWSLLFEMIFLWFIGTPIEEEWGSFHYLLFFLICTLGAAAAALLLPLIFSKAIIFPFFSPGAALLGIVYTFSRRHPDQQFYLMFVVPVKAKYFVLLYLGIRIFQIFGSNSNYVLATLIVELTGAAAGVFYNYLRSNFKEKVREIKTTAQKQSIKKSEESLLEKRIKTLQKIVILQKKAALDGQKNRELEEWIKKHKEEKFDFEVCALSDFHKEDKYCLQCEAFQHCLAKKITEE